MKNAVVGKVVHDEVAKNIDTVQTIVTSDLVKKSTSMLEKLSTIWKLKTMKTKF